MSSDEILQEAVRRIQAQIHPARILLFGSRARGDARADSDFDLAVVVAQMGNKWQVEADMYGLLFDLGAAFDVLAFDADHWRRWSRVPSAFEHKILREGKELAHGEP